MRNADDMRQTSQDNVPTAAVDNAVNRIENELVVKAKQGERSHKTIVPYVLSEKIFAALEEAGYSVKVNKKSIIKGCLFEITW